MHNGILFSNKEKRNHKVHAWRCIALTKNKQNFKLRSEEHIILVKSLYVDITKRLDLD